MKDDKNLLIYSGNSLKIALEKLDKNKQRLLICVNQYQHVLGVLTDGDIRRALLQNYQLEDSIDDFINTRYSYLNVNASFDEVCELFKDQKIDFLPILDEEKKLKNILTKKQFHILLLENIEFNLLDDFTKIKDRSLEHEIYNRPWGFYKSTLLTSLAQAKVITVFPGEKLSLQEHKQREEHWVIIKGNGEVVLGESKILAYPGSYFFIPKGCKHRIINTSKHENLILSEVQLGEYFGEDDIIRYDDKYGRIK